MTVRFWWIAVLGPGCGVCDRRTGSHSSALAGINLQYGLAAHRTEQIRMFETTKGRVELRAVTGPDYGRI